jgi:argininosuccinate lyase
LQYVAARGKHSNTKKTNQSCNLNSAAPALSHIVAGFTHLQQAQTVRWGHWLMSHASAWQRDDMRLRDLLPRVATLPLGSGALAGNPFLVDRQFIARELGMVGGVCPNSMDAVSDRE